MRGNMNPESNTDGNMITNATASLPAFMAFNISLYEPHPPEQMIGKLTFVAVFLGLITNLFPLYDYCPMNLKVLKRRNLVF